MSDAIEAASKKFKKSLIFWFMMNFVNKIIGGQIAAINFKCELNFQRRIEQIRMFLKQKLQ